jgi:hypothetical protein
MINVKVYSYCNRDTMIEFFMTILFPLFGDSLRKAPSGSFFQLPLTCPSDDEDDIKYCRLDYDYYIVFTIHRTQGITPTSFFSVSIVKKRTDSGKIKPHTPLEAWEFHSKNFVEAFDDLNSCLKWITGYEMDLDGHSTNAEIKERLELVSTDLEEVLSCKIPITPDQGATASALDDLCHSLFKKTGVSTLCYVDDLTINIPPIDGCLNAIRVLKAAWEAHHGRPEAIAGAGEDPETTRLVILARTLSLRRFCRVRGPDVEDMETEVVEPFARDIVEFL